MSKAFKIVLMVCAIVLVLAVSGSMIYYYVFFRPGIERAEQQSEIANKKALTDCLAQAEAEHQRNLTEEYERYIQNWDIAIETQKRLDNTKKDDTLPPDIGERIDNIYQDGIERADKQYENTKADCFKLHGE